MAKAIVNPEVCQGHTLCNFAAPEVFHLRDEMFGPPFTEQQVARFREGAVPDGEL